MSRSANNMHARQLWARAVATGLVAIFMAKSADARSVSREATHDEASEKPSAKSREGGSDDEVNRIDINRASVEELCTLPGIGKKRAEAIVDYRRRRPFTRLTQLLNIKGIGKRTLEKLRPRLMVGPRVPDPLVRATAGSE